MLQPFSFGDKVYNESVDLGGTVLECVPAGYNGWLVKVTYDKYPSENFTVSPESLKLVNTIIHKVVDAAEKTLTTAKKGFKPFLVCDNGNRVA